MISWFLRKKLIKLFNPTFEACIGKVQNTTGFEERSFAYGSLQFFVRCETCFCRDKL